MKTKRIDLASSLDRTGLKRVTLFYDDESNELFIEESGSSKPVVDEKRFAEMIASRLEELSAMHRPEPKPHRGAPTYTKQEQLMLYYWYCLNHDFGQGERTMFESYGGVPYKKYSYEQVERYVSRMLDRYRNLGYNI